jgi:hypothetical protein
MNLHDTPQRPLNQKIELAIQHYQDKYRTSPNICYVHPSALSKDGPAESHLQVIAADFILPHHFWIGVVDPETVQRKDAARHKTVTHRPSASPTESR